VLRDDLKKNAKIFENEGIFGIMSTLAEPEGRIRQGNEDY
jgi:hypothetical protein